MLNSARTYVLAAVFAIVCAATIGLVLSGINLSMQQKRVDELAGILQSQQTRMKDLYGRRADLIQKWLDGRKAAPGNSPVVTDTATPDTSGEVAEATAAESAPGAVQESTRTIDATIKTALSESQKIDLLTQDDFDRFDQLQNEITAYVASTLLESLRGEVAQSKDATLADSIKEFESLETDIAQARREYHSAALERNDLVAALNNLPFGMGNRPPPAPLFTADASLQH